MGSGCAWIGKSDKAGIDMSADDKDILIDNRLILFFFVNKKTYAMLCKCLKQTKSECSQQWLLFHCKRICHNSKDMFVYTL